MSDSKTPRNDELTMDMVGKSDAEHLLALDVLSCQLETELFAKERELAEMRQRDTCGREELAGLRDLVGRANRRSCDLADDLTAAREAKEKSERELAAWGEAVRVALGLDVAPDCEADLIAALRWYRLKMEKELAGLRERLADIDEAYRAVMAERCAGDERHCTCVPFLRAEIKALRERAERAERERDEEHAFALRSEIAYHQTEDELHKTREAVRGAIEYIRQVNSVTDDGKMLEEESRETFPREWALIDNLRSCLPGAGTENGKGNGHE